MWEMKCAGIHMMAGMGVGYFQRQGGRDFLKVFLRKPFLLTTLPNTLSLTSSLRDPSNKRSVSKWRRRLLRANHLVASNVESDHKP